MASKNVTLGEVLADFVCFVLFLFILETKEGHGMFLWMLCFHVMLGTVVAIFIIMRGINLRTFCNRKDGKADTGKT